MVSGGGGGGGGSCIFSARKTFPTFELKLKIKDDDKSETKPSIDLGTKPAKETPVDKLLTTSVLGRQFKIYGQIGETEQKDKLSFTSLVRQIRTGLS